MPEPLEDALAALRPLLLDVERLVRAVAAGRRRSAAPAHVRAEVRPVSLKGGRRLQVVTTDGRAPTTANHEPGPDAETAVDALLAEPFGSWHVETAESVVQLRVTKRGEAQVHTSRTSRREATAAHDRVQRHLLDPGDPLFAALGADADKRRQVDAFLRQVQAAVKGVLADVEAAARPLRVVDVGCGNAYLTVAAHRWLAGLPQTAAGGVQTVGVDVRPDMAARNGRLAVELGLAGLRFVPGTIADAEPALAGVDVALALHACDTATDEALARAVRWRTPVILAAPCCHHDVQRQLAAARVTTTTTTTTATDEPAHPVPPHPYAALTRHAILGERFADVLTDALRADLLRLLGYRVDVVEFVASRHTPRNVLLRARWTGTPASGRRVAEYVDLTRAWRVEPALARMLPDEVASVLAR